jgi:hypothetical protein
MKIDRLLDVATPHPLTGHPRPDEIDAYLAGWGEIGAQLARLLRQRNGFYAFENALLVRPFGAPSRPRDIATWNQVDLWISLYYRFRLGEMLFFAEDIFGDQFALREGEVVHFDAETASVRVIAGSLGEWAERILADSRCMTAYPFACEWQTIHGPLAPGYRLVPKIPFVCGGEYAAANLAEAEEVDGMAFRAQIANQIRDLSDGSQVKFVFG